MNPTLTINEVARIARVPNRSVEKAIETGVVKTRTRRAMFTNRPSRHLEVEAVCYFVTLRNIGFLKESPVSQKKTLMSAIRQMRGTELKVIELEPGLSLDLPSIAGEPLREARQYYYSKTKYITSNPEIFGGVPIIKNTRIPVYAVRDRLEDGDTIESLVEDYPEIPSEAFNAAWIYAQTHPERGRPVAGGRPWEAAA